MVNLVLGCLGSRINILTASLLAIIDYRVLFDEVVVADLTITTTDSGKIPLLKITIV